MGMTELKEIRKLYVCQLPVNIHDKVKALLSEVGHRDGWNDEDMENAMDSRVSDVWDCLKGENN